MTASLKLTLRTRLGILQKQIDEANKSGRTHNCLGVPMKEQIEEWEKLIVECQHDLEECPA